MGPYFGCLGSLLGPYFTNKWVLIGSLSQSLGSLLVLEAVDDCGTLNFSTTSGGMEDM